MIREDKYPSRGGRKAELVPRKDPVVYQNHPEKVPEISDFIKEYEKNGFIILEDLFSDEEIKSYQEELERLRTDEELKKTELTITEPGNGDVRSVFKVHEVSPIFKKLAADKRLAKIASAILNDSVYVHQSRVNYKPGFKGKEFYWHSDFETWHVEDGMPSMRALSVSIALTENYPNNGALMLVPGSHKVYAVCEGTTPENHFKSSLKKQEYGVPDDESLKKMVDQGGIVTATGKPGTVILFDCNSMHGSNGNITPYPRSNIFFVYNAMSNKVVDPFCDQPPRPDYISARENTKPVLEL